MNDRNIIREGLEKICNILEIPYNNEVKSVETTLARLSGNNPINVLSIEEVEEALDPCPWCGEEVSLEDNSYESMAPASYRCVCDNEDCSVQPHSATFETKKSVRDFGYVPKEWQKPLIESWNTKSLVDDS